MVLGICINRTNSEHPWIVLAQYQSTLGQRKKIILKTLNNHLIPSLPFWASLVAQMIKNLPAMQETWVQSLGWEDSPGGGHGNPLQYSYLENPHGQRSLAGCSPWGRKEADTTE